MESSAGPGTYVAVNLDISKHTKRTEEEELTNETKKQALRSSAQN
jgi:hypothetical protein